MEKKLQNNEPLNIQELIASIKRVNDIQYSVAGNNIFYITNNNGNGEFFEIFSHYEILTALK